MTKFDKWFLPLTGTRVFCQVLNQHHHPPKAAKEAKVTKVARGNPQKQHQYQREVVVVERPFGDGN